MSAEVGIIIVSYNQRKFLTLLLESLADQSFKNFCIYFVDNGSKDGSVEYGKRLCTELNLDAQFIELKENTGYTGGNNYGVGIAVGDSCKYCLILNSDTELEKECLQSLINCIESEPEIAATGPILLIGIKSEQNTIIQEFGAHGDFKNYKIIKNFSGVLFNQIEKEIPDCLQVNYLTGACMLLKSSVYNKIGLFDERYFAYGEEIDLFKKIEDNGLKVLVTKNARVWHHHNWSVKNKSGYYFEYYLIQRNKYLYFKKHKYYKALIISLLKDSLFLPVSLRWFLKICDFRLFLFYLKGTVDGLINHRGNPYFK